MRRRSPRLVPPGAPAGMMRSRAGARIVGVMTGAMKKRRRDPAEAAARLAVSVTKMMSGPAQAPGDPATMSAMRRKGHALADAPNLAMMRGRVALGVEGVRLMMRQRGTAPPGVVGSRATWRMKNRVAAEAAALVAMRRMSLSRMRTPTQRKPMRPMSGPVVGPGGARL